MTTEKHIICASAGCPTHTGAFIHLTTRCGRVRDEGRVVGYNDSAYRAVGYNNSRVKGQSPAPRAVGYNSSNSELERLAIIAEVA
jgi:hypothetical protein